MEIRNKASRIDLLSIRTPQMRAFHVTWFAFFLCFFAWFGIAPLMAVVREELSLTKQQIGNTMIASVAITILARLLIGWLCDRIGPRLAYTWLLTLGSLPVMGIGLAHSYEAFLLFRLGIGVIGASFVITQYHTSVMFAPNCVGTANATTAGWGNLGGGVTQIVMPLVFAAFIALGFSSAEGWRASMVVAGAVCFLTGIAYFFLTTDFPDGNLKDLRARGEIEERAKTKGSFAMAMRDRRVWFLFVLYAACFGIELTINNVAALYFKDYFGLSLGTAGLVAGLFGLMNIFARTLGGYVSDRFVGRGGLNGRVRWLFVAVLAEGLALLWFSQMRVLAFAIPSLIVFSLFVQMSEGATYSVVPFVNKRALGAVAGIVGAGGNLGAVTAGFLFRAEGISYPDALLILGGAVTLASFSALLVRFSPAEEAAARAELVGAMARREAELAARPPRRVRVPALTRMRPMDALRIYLGIALMIKGVYFLTDMTPILAPLEEVGVESINWWSHLVAWGVVGAHVVGGLCLALGFVTRVAAGVNAIVLLGAVGAHVVGSDWNGLLTTNRDFQFVFFVFFTLVLVAWRGAGPFSLDRFLRIESGRAQDRAQVAEEPA